jgi:prepilin-type N-terminal cleavage/methylation domain-containing protein
MMNIFTKTKYRKGFTLIEMLVSVALFSVVMTIVAAAYLNLLNLDRQAKATNDVAANLNFVLDTMARSIRTGTQYGCGVSGGNCAYPSSGDSQFSFLDDDGKTYTTYTLTNNQIMECQSTTLGCVPNIPVTDPRIAVDKLKFYVTGIDGTGVHNADGVEPRVTFVIHGSITIDPAHAPVTFDIQTSATQRQIDI